MHDRRRNRDECPGASVVVAALGGDGFAIETAVAMGASKDPGAQSKSLVVSDGVSTQGNRTLNLQIESRPGPF
jgi:hypothetical protein